MLTPKEIQSRIRAGASVQQVAEATGVDVSRVKRFAHPVLLERCVAAELATAAHPVLADGPAVMTLLETVTTALVARGLDHDTTTWDAWKNEDGRWTVQLAWPAGRSDNRAHFRFTPGAHGGTVTPLDEAATELIDPNFDRPLRPVAALAQLDFDEAHPPRARTSHRHSRPARVAASRPCRHGKTCCWACAREASVNALRDLAVASDLIPPSRRAGSGLASPTIDQAEPGRPMDAPAYEITSPALSSKDAGLINRL